MGRCVSSVYFDWLKPYLSAVLTFHMHARETLIVQDDHGNIIAVFIGRPVEENGQNEWMASVGRAADRLEAARSENEKTFDADARVHRRGEYVAVHTGISYGGGQKVRPVSSNYCPVSYEVYAPRSNP